MTEATPGPDMGRARPVAFGSFGSRVVSKGCDVKFYTMSRERFGVKLDDFLSGQGGKNSRIMSDDE